MDFEVWFDKMLVQQYREIAVGKINTILAFLTRNDYPYTGVSDHHFMIS